FYFTTERDSYGAKLGQTANLGVISAVFFRERRPYTITPVTPSQSRPPYEKEDTTRDQRSAPSSSAGEPGRTEGGREAAKSRSVPSYPPPDDESAATGIGRSVRNDVQWIKMDLDPRPASDITISPHELGPAVSAAKTIDFHKNDLNAEGAEGCAKVRREERTSFAFLCGILSVLCV
ncbi:MAG: hypothetical protein DMF76_22480, partial [Acidobacteria bacterium]